MTNPYADEEPFEVDADAAPGPDEHDIDLMDGSWEQRYYAGQEQKRDWRSIQIGILILLLVSFAIPAVLIFTR